MALKMILLPLAVLVTSVLARPSAKPDYIPWYYVDLVGLVQVYNDEQCQQEHGQGELVDRPDGTVQVLIRANKCFSTTPNANLGDNVTGIYSAKVGHVSTTDATCVWRFFGSGDNCEGLNITVPNDSSCVQAARGTNGTLVFPDGAKSVYAECAGGIGPSSWCKYLKGP